MNTLTLFFGAYLAVSSLMFKQVISDDWSMFKAANEKVYESRLVEQMRKVAFENNKRRVEEHNIAEGRQFELALNELSDKTEPELKNIMNGLKGEELEYDRPENSAEAEEFLKELLKRDDALVPDEFDWRKVAGRVSPVRNQGLCGSCWAFATLGSLEGQQFRLNGSASFGDADLVELSVQNLIDCDETSNGCNGGLTHTALEFIRTQGGVQDRKSYRYQSRRFDCSFDKNKAVMSVKGFVLLPEGDEIVLKKVLAYFGPVTIGIDASDSDFELYKEGLYNPAECSDRLSKLDHSLLLVGYGSDPQLGDFWIAKNSFGGLWGEKGYVRLPRNQGNRCGVASYAVIPLI